MANYRCTAFFNAPTFSCGWSETYWSYPTASYALVQASFGKLIKARLGLCLSGVWCVGLRCANIDHPRDGMTVPPAPGSDVGALDPTTYPLAGMYDCLLVRLEGDSVNWFNHKYLRFVPKTIFNGNLYDPSQAGPLWVPNWNAYVTELTSGNWFVVSKVEADPPILGALTTVTPMRRTEHKLGAPFGQPHGKRRVA